MVRRSLEEDDWWADHRDQMKDLHTVLIFVATVSSITCVIASIIWLTHSATYIHDAHDYLWYIQNVPSGVCDGLLIVGCLAMGIALLCQIVVLTADPKASICFCCGTILEVSILLYWLRSNLGSKARMTKPMKTRMPLYLGMLDEAFAAFEGKTARTPVESSAAN